ncbi:MULTISPECIES: SMODS domain-containing nucleotidyltransferase [unclassified Brevundimonas]|uniref:SMODS domain-containing nucleotidyltransferase n=1 Tax=unclassified Brevundimonas TaxID=2622653 RepID=UPI0025B87BAD|nr:MULTISPECIES: hypothetical protein [unclassified Brevundimonas]
MKLIEHFNDFLRDTVNLNATRLQTLEKNSEAIETYLRGSDWEPSIQCFERQGSWAHGTIIRPVDQGEFDADLLVLVDPVEDWTAADYVRSLVATFRSSGVYRDKVKGWPYCATITYANDAMVDVAPLVIGREIAGRPEVCNRSADRFERSEPMAYTAWLIEKNSYSGSNSFRKVTRLIKFLRDIKTRFVCSSVLLTTLLAQQINEADKGSAEFADVPTALQTVMGRLDDWLQARADKPAVCNPFLAAGADAEDFASAWTQDQYTNFRASIHRYRGWIDEAIVTADRDASVRAWRRLFGDDFAASVKLDESAGRFALASPTAPARTALQDLVDLVVTFGRSAIPVNFRRVPHMQRPTWTDRRDPDLEVVVGATLKGGAKSMYAVPVLSGDPLKPNQKIWFHALRSSGEPIGSEFVVHWRITNTGDVPAPRGDYYASELGHERAETLEWRGVHLAEAFVVRRIDGSLASISEPFYVVITD